MIVSPFWFGIGVGIFGTIMFELIAFIVFAIYLSNKARKE